MKSRIKKIIFLIAAVIMAFSFSMTSFAAARATLDVKDYKENGAAKKLKEERSLGNGAMKFSIPSDWKSVETPLENIEGYQYKLNELPKEKKSDAEEIFVFYFSNERYLDDLRDADDREGIEKAIVTNILPEQNMIGINIAGITFPSVRLNPDGSDWLGYIYPNNCYDYFDTKYKDKNGKVHNAEFVFYRNGNDGMCCELYVYSESVHKEDIIYMIKTTKTSKTN